MLAVIVPNGEAGSYRSLKLPLLVSLERRRMLYLRLNLAITVLRLVGLCAAKWLAPACLTLLGYTGLTSLHRVRPAANLHEEEHRE